MKEKFNNNKVYCSHCNGDGIIREGDTFYTCPFCTQSAELMMKIEMAIAEMVIDGRDEDAMELHSVYDLLHDCPVLAVMQARELGFPKKLVDQIIKVFDVKRLE
tara:strand:+ start:78 stop:389 length:312 start_codon:yes stop_codon:yes gene_type:complete